MYHWVSLFILFLPLAACQGGGGDGEPTVQDPRPARLAEYQAQQQRIIGGLGTPGIALTSAVNMPVTGQVTYRGGVNITIATDPGPIVLAGDSTVTIAFDAGTVSGSLTNFFGSAAGEPVTNYTGELQIDAGSVGDGNHNSWTADYAGTLDSGQAGITFDGDMAGNFHGDAAVAISGGDVDGVARVDGANVDMIMVIAADQAPP